MCGENIRNRFARNREGWNFANGKISKETNEHSQFAKDRSKGVQLSLLILLSFSCVCYGHLTPSSLLHKHPECRHHRMNWMANNIKCSSAVRVRTRCQAEKINKKYRKWQRERKESMRNVQWTRARSARRVATDLTCLPLQQLSCR